MPVPRALPLFARFPLDLIAGVLAGPFGPRRMAVVLLVAPCLIALWMVHAVSLLLDELWFPGYRRVPVREPLFVVGLPRSGTSAMQEILAGDPAHTSLRLWHLILAPAICQRRLVRRMIAVDRRIGRPGARLKARVEGLAFGFMEDVHPVDFDAPEEDYFLLAPVFACFLLVVPFPRSRRVWSLTRIDDWPAPARRRLAAFYRSMVQRHLHECPAGVRLLSKNPMFTPFVRTLLETFPDARIVACVRDPRKVVPSLLSSLEDGAALFGWNPAEPEHRDRFVTMLEEFGDRLLELERELGSSFTFLVLRDVRRDLLASVETLYERFGRAPDAEFRRSLRARAHQARSHASGHTYRLKDYGLDAGTVESRFRNLMDRFQFTTSGGDPDEPPAWTPSR